MKIKTFERVGVLIGALVVASLVYAFFTLSPQEKYVGVIAEVQPKTVMLKVPAIVERMVITFDDGVLDIHKSTAAVNFLGSGVFVGSRGFILTCAHVVECKHNGPIIATLSNGTTVQAKVLYMDADMDLALLKVRSKKGQYSKASLVDSPLQLGQEVIAVGNPEGQAFSTTHGIVSHLGRDIDEMYTFTQIDAAINPGNSGGPLFNLQGELIGINARGFVNADGMGLAIAPSTIKEFLNTFKGIGE